jgi:formylmethanofuran dehydrogenase subunit B
VVVVGADETPTAAQADLFIRCTGEDELELLAILRASLAGKTVDHARVLKNHSLSLSQYDDLVRRLKSARYGALFYQCRQQKLSHATACWEAAGALVRALNDGASRFVLLGMGTAGNLAGAEAALAWQTGFAGNVDFRLGFPIPFDEFGEIEDVFISSETDLVLIIGDHWPSGLSEVARARLRDVKTIVIGPAATALTDPRPTVAIATATTGIDSGGTAMRCDGVALPLRPPLYPVHPSDRECLRELARQYGVAPPSLQERSAETSHV